MQTAFLILIGIVFILSIFFAILIWRQTVKFEKKALAAKRRKEEYMRQLELENEKEEAIRLASEKEQSAEELDDPERTEEENKQSE